MTNAPTRTSLALSLGLLCATTAQAADFEVRRTIHLPASPTEVWHHVGDFCDIDDWHPDISACALKVVDGSLTRILTTTDGATFTEKRIASEQGLSYTYKITDAPIPVEKFTATFSIEPRNGSQVDWYVRFSSDDPTTEAMVATFFDTGLKAIERTFTEN